MTKLYSITIVVLIFFGMFFPQVIFSQDQAASSFYRSVARRGVGYQTAAPITPFQKQSQQTTATKLQPEIRVPLQPVTRQDIVSDFIVTNTNDTGAGSFRRAITDANANSGLDRITFNIPGGTVHTIMPVTSLPDITDPIIIDGTTQSGYAGAPLIELNGSLAPAESNGLQIKAGHSIVRGLVINRFIANGNIGGMGILIDNNGGNTIEGNYIGTNATGDTAKGNGGSGIGVFGASSGNLIGGITAAARNVISGNGFSGIQITTGSAGRNLIQGNYIGISATTWDSIGNLGNGIIIDAIGDTVGGDYSVAKNIIADNGMPGIALLSNAMNTVIQGNSIGWLSGDVAWGNHEDGIAILGAQNILVGDTTDGKRNLIAANAYSGIAIVGNTATGNIVEGNWIGGSLKISPVNGTIVAGNLIGVYIENAPKNVIGGQSVGARNHISLNKANGVVIRGSEASGNRLEGNAIGLSGILSLIGQGNKRNGVVIDDAPKNSIGGSDPSAANYISGNELNGILITGAGATGNVVRGNMIGISQAPNPATWGNLGDGIVLVASGDTIGGEGFYDGNTIAYNRKTGIYDSVGNHNAILHNSIYSNNNLGIDLAPRGFTKNDLLDADAGANEGQNYPILDSLSFDSPGSIRIHGRMNGLPYSTVTLDFYKSDTCNASKFGDGQTYIGSGPVTCDDNGIAEFHIALLTALVERDYVTATARDEFGNTSEFSRALRMLDSDGDGILDIWEERGGGIDWNSDGVIDLDLWARNADPFHKDLFVEIDKMEGQLTFPDALVEVEQAFHQVPNKYVNNPDGNDGINLHAEYDYASVPIPGENWTDPPWAAFLAVKATHFGTDVERADTNAVNILNAKKLVYRYCIFAQNYSPDGSSGLAYDIYSKDFMVTLGPWSTPAGTKEEQAGTFMHELGHTLGLRHGGVDNIKWKPNFYSVMNYLWQFPRPEHLPGSWALNYSPVAITTLDEPHLDELRGLDPQWGDYPIVSIPYRRPDSTIAQALLAPSTPVNWDGDMDSSGYSSMPVDINRFMLDKPINATQTLYGYADWPNLRHSVRNLSEPLPIRLEKMSADTSMDEMTPDIYQIIKNLPPYGIIKPLSHWSQDSSLSSSIATGYFSDIRENAVRNGEGGAFIAWMHIWNEFSGWDSSWDIRAQRIDSLGRILWDNNGVSVSKGEKAPQLPSIVSDGSDGAIVTWDDVRLGDGNHGVYSQHIDRYGRERWTSHGVSVTSDVALKNPLYPTSISDRRGGAIIMWSENNGVHAQRMDSAGTRHWTTNGLFLLPGTGAGEIKVVSDGTGGAIVFWRNRTVGGPYYFPWYAQRIDSTGTVLWGSNGIQVSPVTTISCVATEDIGGGAIIVFTDIPTDPGQKVCLQRIGLDGSLRWPLNGVQVDTVYQWANKSSHQIVQDNQGVITIGWIVKYYGVQTYDLFLQRVDTAGAIQWPAGGIHVTGSLTSTHWNYFLVGTNNRRVIVLYESSRDEYRAKYFDSTGILPWSVDGVPVNHGPGDNSGIHAVADNNDGAIVVYGSTGFMDKLGSQFQYWHIYAQRLNQTGGLGEGIVTGIHDGHSSLPTEFELMQNYPNPFNPRTIIKFRLPVASNVTIRIYNVLGQCVNELFNEIETAGEHSVVWNTNSIASGVYFYRFEATSIGDPVKSFIQVKKMVLVK